MMYKIIAVLAALGGLLLIAGAFWLIFCGIYALICFCFGLEFNWLVATGILLVCLLVKWLITPSQES